MKTVRESLKTFLPTILIVHICKFSFFLPTLITTTTILSAGERFDKLQSNGHSLKKYKKQKNKKKPHLISPKKRDRREVDVFSDIIMMTANFTVELLKSKSVKQKFGSRNLEEI